MVNAVIDTSVLVGFSGIGRLDILWAVFSEIAIVPAVYREVVTQGDGWVAAREAQAAILAGNRLKRVSVPEASDGSLGTRGIGEVEVARYACHYHIPALIDDGLARRFARGLGVKEVIGSLGILARAKRSGAVVVVAPLVADLRQCGIRFADEVVEGFLRDLNEY